MDTDKWTFGGIVHDNDGLTVLSLEGGGGFGTVAHPMSFNPKRPGPYEADEEIPLPTHIQFRVARKTDGGRDIVWVQLPIEEVLDGIPQAVISAYVEK